MKIVSAKITTLVHATESLEKVLRALRNISLVAAEITRKRAKGHHGNEIIILDQSIRNAELGERVLRDVLSKLTTVDRIELFSDLRSRIDDEGTLHFRLDKQGAFRGLMRLQDVDPIKVAVSFRPPPSRQTGFDDQVRKVLEEILATPDSEMKPHTIMGGIKESSGE